MSKQRWPYEVKLEEDLVKILSGNDKLEIKLEKIYAAFKAAGYEWNHTNPSNPPSDPKRKANT